MTFQKKNDVAWLVLSIVCFSSLSALAQSYSYDKADWEGGIPDGCTTITVGKLATADGSVITSHTCDSHRTRGWLTIAAPATYEKESELTLVAAASREQILMIECDSDEAGNDLVYGALAYALENNRYSC